MNTFRSNGFKFLDFLIVNEAEIYDYQRLAGSYAVIKCNERYLLCYNTLRSQWELPAGQREENESPMDCAIRELYEETGQSVSKLDFKGLLKVMTINTGEIKYNPLYFTTIGKLQPFQRNRETSAIHLWDLEREIGYIDEVDIKVFNYIR